MKLILVRHGESLWNLENRFTGWVDVSLSDKGREEAKEAGKLIKSLGVNVDVCYTSILKRANETLNIILKELNINQPIYKTYMLNERHYGALQGLNKDECKKEFGDELFFKYRRSFKTRPPKTNDNSLSVKTEDYNPDTESLEDTYKRVIKYFNDNIKENLKTKNILIAAHGNTLRSLIKYLDNISDEDIEHVEVKTGQVIVYTFDDMLNVVDKKIYEK